jgi:transcriptional regulator
MRHEPKVPIPERNRQILQMRKEGVQRLEVARRFRLSPSRIDQIEKRDAGHCDERARYGFDSFGDQYSAMFRRSRLNHQAGDFRDRQ